MVRDMKGSLFEKPRDKKLAKIISIKDPGAFRRSIRTLEKDGITPKERSALILAKNRAGAQLNRKNLSMKERKEFKIISKTEIPKVKGGRKR